jgi:O-acetylserine/cysteine efflux transporter
MALPLSDGLRLVAVAFIWGFNFVVIRIGLDHFPPLFFSALRFLVCALPALLWVQRPKIALHDLLALGIVLGTFLFAFLFLGIRAGMPAGLASLAMQSQVFLTVLLGALVLGERPRPTSILALALGAAGLVLLALDQSQSGSLVALVLVMSGAFSWAVSNLLLKRLPPVEMGGLMVWISLVPPLPLLALSALTEGPVAMVAALRHLDLPGVAVVLYTGLVSTVLAYGIWGAMLQRHPVALVAPFALLVPIFGPGSAALVLGERPSWVAGAACVLVIAALMINCFGPRMAGPSARCGPTGTDGDQPMETP